MAMKHGQMTDRNGGERWFTNVLMTPSCSGRGRLRKTVTGFMSLTDRVTKWQVTLKSDKYEGGTYEKKKLCLYIYAEEL